MSTIHYVPEHLRHPAIETLYDVCTKQHRTYFCGVETIILAKLLATMAEKNISFEQLQVAVEAL